MTDNLIALRELALRFVGRGHRGAGDRRAAAPGGPPRRPLARESIRHSWWHIPGGRPIVRRVIEEAGAYGIDVHLIARREPPPG